MSGGRPSTYTPEAAQRFCDALATGALGVEIAQRPGMPSLDCIRRWRMAHPEFREAYAIAREMQAQACAERAVLSGRRATAENAAAARVQFDADRWLAARIDPRNYSDRVATQNLDKDGNPTDPPIPVLNLTVNDASHRVNHEPTARDFITHVGPPLVQADEG